MFWWNLKLFKIILSNIEKKQDFLGVYKKKIVEKLKLNSNMLWTIQNLILFTQLTNQVDLQVI
jgi:hypothetical protein